MSDEPDPPDPVAPFLARRDRIRTEIGGTARIERTVREHIDAGAQPDPEADGAVAQELRAGVLQLGGNDSGVETVYAWPGADISFMDPR